MLKGIILAGGSGSRLYPLTQVTSKQLLPVYDKPLIYYPLSVLMEAGIKDILIISTPVDLPRFEELFKDGSQYGMKFSYLVQEKPEGLAQAFTLGKDFIGDDPVAMVLGDNVFFGNTFENKLHKAAENAEKGFATVFGYPVSDPERFGTLEFDEEQNVTGIVEKDPNPKSNYAVTGLYFYPKGVAAKAAEVKKSIRNEYEITDLNILYLKDKVLKVSLLNETYIWRDAGTISSLFDTASLVKLLQLKKGKVIGCIEEIAYKKGWINNEQLLQFAEKYKNSEYALNLNKLAGK